MPAIVPRVLRGKTILIVVAAAVLIMSIVGLNIYRSRQQVPVEVTTATAQVECVTLMSRVEK